MRFFKKPSTLSINSLSFDTVGWTLVEHSAQHMVWKKQLPHGLYLNFFPIPPDIPVRLSESTALESFYRDQVQPTGGTLVQFAVQMLVGVQAVKTIFKFPRQPSGMGYLGSFTLPFAEFSFVIKAQCEEYGYTGIREAVIGDSLVAEGKFDINKDNPRSIGILADDEQYDAQFPKHPLSHVRTYLKHIEATLKLKDEVLNAPRFRIL